MAEPTGELVYLPHHRQRRRIRAAEIVPPPEEAQQEALMQLFDQMVDLATMPAPQTSSIEIVAQIDPLRPEREHLTYHISQCTTKGLAFYEQVDVGELERYDGHVTIMEFMRLHYHGMWQYTRQPDELQYGWERVYEDSSLQIVPTILTQDIAAKHGQEVIAEINYRAHRQRMRYMVGFVALTDAQR